MPRLSDDGGDAFGGEEEYGGDRLCRGGQLCTRLCAKNGKSVIPFHALSCPVKIPPSQMRGKAGSERKCTLPAFAEQEPGPDLFDPKVSFCLLLAALLILSLSENVNSE